MKIGDRVEACGRCFEYYNIVPGASGTIIGKPENYTGYVVEFDGIHNEKSYDGSFYITPSCLRPLTYKIAKDEPVTITYEPTYFSNDAVTAALAYRYCNKMEGVKSDMNRKSIRSAANPLEIKNVYFNDPVTVVMWNDGTKTIVRCSENDFYDPEKGLAMAIVKKAYGNDNKFHKVFKKWIPEEDEAQKGANLRSSDLSAHFSMLFRSCTVCKHRGQPANMDPCLTCSLGLTGLMHPCFEPADSLDLTDL